MLDGLVVQATGTHGCLVTEGSSVSHERLHYLLLETFPGAGNK